MIVKRTERYQMDCDDGRESIVFTDTKTGHTLNGMPKKHHPGLYNTIKASYGIMEPGEFKYLMAGIFAANFGDKHEAEMVA